MESPASHPHEHGPLSPALWRRPHDPIVQMRKMRLREAEPVSWGHTASKSVSLGLPDSEPSVLGG